jgi:hypothetical protein
MQYIQLQGQVASTLESPSNGAFNLFVDTSDNTIKVKDENGNLTGVSGSGGGASIEEVTFSELNDLWDGENLTAGQYYKITDYQTCYDQPNWDAARNAITTGNYKSGSVEPLVVFATSDGTLSPYAYSLDYPKDTIKYDISFTETEVTNGLAKGRIYERIDERGNRTDYDWRAVQFKRYTQYYAQNTYGGKVSVTTTNTTGSVIGVDTNFSGIFEAGDVIGVYNPGTSAIGGFDFYEVVDVSGSYYMGITGSYYNTISDTYYSLGNTYSGLSPFQTNTISVGKAETENYTFDDMSDSWYNNYLGDNKDWDTFILSNNVFRDGDYRDNYFGSNVVGNTFDDDHYGNKIGRNFQYNVLEDDFDNNTIGDGFQFNFVSCDFQENIIANNFEYNMITDDDGVDFNFNIINGDSFTHNWTIGYDHFHSNIITDDFNNNIIWNRFGNNLVNGSVYDNLFDGDTDYNQFKQSFNSNKIYNSFQNNVLNSFYSNTISSLFNRNQFNGTAYSNVLTGSFYDNTIGHNFYGNTFAGETAYNQIGSGFYNNTIGDSFGVGGGDPRTNKIGSNVYGNTIGEYFYSNTISDNFYNNTIGDYFQQNSVLANNVNNVNFNEYYGNITSASIANPNVGGSDGVYTLIPTTTNGQGIDATFDVTIVSGIASIAIVNVGRLYNTDDTLIITGSLIGGGSNLEIDVDTISDTPMVYRDVDCTILKNQNNQIRLTYFAVNGFGVVDINGPVD